MPNWKALDRLKSLQDLRAAYFADSFLKQVKESDEKKKEAKEKGDWAQLHRVNPGLLEPGYRLLTT